MVFVLKKRQSLSLNKVLKKLCLRVGCLISFKEYYYTYFVGIKFHVFKT
nr:MAG TPA: hypothetical protein [Caudoviricetes sp.]